ncbi:hypothetical protein ONR75_18540 [Rhodopseudomonas sp. P2A-2r]|uniref:hypothetical protein n=1 Tax=Rhodopseudomonas sp. P2A-2r TaxID=2991972 RepID=UPI0022343520|nr:hypothetical protein [Rhodopseudomonas sp. P2A-2r]UZE47003.1 hypothetical protein ONR75_18540 [Rhodopseudomonas sp. P2A-2r]
MFGFDQISRDYFRISQLLAWYLPFLLWFTWLFLYFSISSLRKNHSKEIYVIWYIASLLFVIFLGLEVIARINNTDIPAICQSYAKYCESGVDFFTNLPGEVTIVTAGVAITVLPQVITYILAGLSGSATAPVWIGEIEAVAFWSIAKFIAGLGGIVLSQPVASLLVGAEWSGYQYFGGFACLAAAFTMAAIRVWMTEVLPTVVKSSKLLPLFRKVHRKFTKYGTETTPAPEYDAEAQAGVEGGVQAAPAPQGSLDSMSK